MQHHLLYYIYGLNTMFYAMAALWLYHHGPRAAHALASSALLAALSLECVKDLPIILGGFALSEYATRIITLADLLVEPLICQSHPSPTGGSVRWRVQATAASLPGKSRENKW